MANGGSTRRRTQQCETAEVRFPVQSTQHLIRRMFYLITVVLCRPLVVFALPRLLNALQPAPRHEMPSQDESERRGGGHTHRNSAGFLLIKRINSAVQTRRQSTFTNEQHGSSSARTYSATPVPSQSTWPAVVADESSYWPFQLQFGLIPTKPNVCLQPWTNSEPQCKRSGPSTAAARNAHVPICAADGGGNTSAAQHDSLPRSQRTTYQRHWPS